MFKASEVFEKLSLFYIDGKWTEAIGDERLSIINPSTEDSLGSLALGNELDVTNAVASASLAFESFRYYPKKIA